MMGSCRGIGRGMGGVGKCILSCHVCYLLKFFFLFSFLFFHPIPWGLLLEKVKQYLFFSLSFSFSLCLTLFHVPTVLVMVTTTLTEKKRKQNVKRVPTKCELDLSCTVQQITCTYNSKFDLPGTVNPLQAT